MVEVAEQSMTDVVPEGRLGRAEVRHVPSARRQGGRVCQLLIGGRPFMSDGDAERADVAEFQARARGRVLMVGLGLGLAVRPLLERPEVLEVVVVERDPDVIGLVGPTLASPKLELVEADARDWPGDGLFDAIWVDVWPDVGGEGLVADMDLLLERYGRMLAPGGWIGAWREGEIRRIGQCGCFRSGPLCASCAEREFWLAFGPQERS